MKKYNSLKIPTLSRRFFLKTAAVGLLTITASPFMLSAEYGNAATRSGKQKVLTVYYSRSGNTRAAARIIHSLVGGDIVELETVQPYPEEYRATTEQAKKELEANYYPQLKTTVADVSSYDVILVGSPSWWGTFASPVRGFLAQHNFSGKKLAPFITHGGSGMGHSVEDVKSLCPNVTILEGIAVHGRNAGNAESEIALWLQHIGLN